MAKLLDVLLPADVFPPRAGGAGWSSHALATALLARGHRVTALVPQRGQHGQQRRIERGVPVIDVGYSAPRVPFLANWGRFERFWPQFADAIVAAASGLERRRLVIHAQHTQALGAAVLAGARLGAPALITVRDHWPWHYFATGLHADRWPLERFGPAATATDLLARRDPLVGTLSLLALPYVLRHMRQRQALLRRCDAVIAVSDYIAARLRPYVAAQRLHVLPNLVDLAQIDRCIAQPPQVQVPAQFVLFAGKLARNKGAHLLPEAMAALRAAGSSSTLVIAGGGDQALLGQIRATGVPVVAFDWLDHDDVLRLMARCQALVFPSTWGEPLSRVLLEACAVGAPIAAIPTGGTPDLLTHAVNALLAPSAQALGAAVAELVQHPQRAQRLGQAARQLAAARLAAPVVAAQVEALYAALLESTDFLTPRSR